MAELSAFPDVHGMLKAVFADLSDNVYGPGLPANLQELIESDGPLIRVRRIGGFDDMITDYARTDVECYSINDFPAARDLAESCRQRLLDAPHHTPAGRLDSARTDVGPQLVPTDDQTLRLVVATYRLYTRR